MHTHSIVISVVFYRVHVQKIYFMSIFIFSLFGMLLEDDMRHPLFLSRISSLSVLFLCMSHVLAFSFLSFIYVWSFLFLSFMFGHFRSFFHMKCLIEFILIIAWTFHRVVCFTVPYIAPVAQPAGRGGGQMGNCPSHFVSCPL